MDYSASSLTHETSRICRVCADLPINFNQPLFDNSLDLVPSQGILEPVSQEHDERNTLPQLMRAGRRSGSLIEDAGKAILVS